MWLPGKLFLVCRSFVPLKVIVIIPLPIIVFRQESCRFLLEHRNGFKTFALDENNCPRRGELFAHLCNSPVPNAKNHFSEMIWILSMHIFNIKRIVWRVPPADQPDVTDCKRIIVLNCLRTPGHLLQLDIVQSDI